MSDLRTRIKDAVWSFYNYDPSWHPDVWAEELADVLIRELRQEWRADYGYDGYDNYDTREEAARNVADFNDTNEPDGGWKDGEQAVVMHRYVTEWENDD